MTLDARILTALRQARGDLILGEELSKQLGVPSATIWARIEALRALGYGIEVSPHRGYSLTSVPDLLHADDLLSRLGEVKAVGRDIRVFQETTSTNDVVEKLARDGVAEGVVVFAETQTKGRGRLGRRWLSPMRQGLWFSTLLRPALHPQAVIQLTLAAAIALTRSIREQTGLRPEIKWPNDVLIRGRKVAGILTDLNAELDTVRYVILGIGVDVNVAVEDFPSDLRSSVTSLQAESGQAVDRAELAGRILGNLDRDYARIGAGDFEAIADEWEGQCSTLGRTVAIQMGPRRIRGRAESLDADGALLLRTEHGHLERIVGGDVVMER